MDPSPPAAPPPGAPSPSPAPAPAGPGAPDGRARLWQLAGMGAGAFALLTLLLGGLVMVLVSAELEVVFRDIGARVDAPTALALGRGPQAAWALVQVLLLGLALWVRGPLRMLLALASMGLGLLGLAFFVVAVYIPFFTLASTI